MKDSIKVSEIFSVSAKRLYEAWLNSKEHTGFTGSKAEIISGYDGKFTADNNFISGKIKILQPYSRIVQTWRTKDFAQTDQDSKLEVLFEKSGEGTRLTLIHSGIPEGLGENYEKRWLDSYFKPMKKYFK